MAQEEYGGEMKLTIHELKVFMDDDYRENVLKGKQSVKQFYTAEQILEELK